MCQPPTRTLTAGLLTLCYSLILLGVVAERISLTPDAPRATPELPAALPSTTAVASKEVEAGLPLLSVVLEPADLYDPVTGIHANPKGRGPAPQGFLGHLIAREFWQEECRDGEARSGIGGGGSP